MYLLYIFSIIPRLDVGWRLFNSDMKSIHIAWYWCLTLHNLLILGIAAVMIEMVGYYSHFPESVWTLCLFTHFLWTTIKVYRPEVRTSKSFLVHDYVTDFLQQSLSSFFLIPSLAGCDACRVHCPVSSLSWMTTDTSSAVIARSPRPGRCKQPDSPDRGGLEIQISPV